MTQASFSVELVILLLNNSFLRPVHVPLPKVALWLSHNWEFFLTVFGFFPAFGQGSATGKVPAISSQLELQNENLLDTSGRTLSSTKQAFLQC